MALTIFVSNSISHIGIGTHSSIVHQSHLELVECVWLKTMEGNGVSEVIRVHQTLKYNWHHREVSICDIFTIPRIQNDQLSYHPIPLRGVWWGPGHM